jgi:hypothetical protein
MQNKTQLTKHETLPVHDELAPLHQQSADPSHRSLSRFVNWDQEAQLEAFFVWLPKELHNAAGIDWTKLPPKVMSYCIRIVNTSQDAAHLAVAIA